MPKVLNNLDNLVWTKMTYQKKKSHTHKEALKENVFRNPFGKKEYKEKFTLFNGNNGINLQKKNDENLRPNLAYNHKECTLRVEKITLIQNLELMHINFLKI
ncbi:hypothetical protein Cni_G14590 [Canna indica]|uniref:Uncharacterized protein n=1 Tax=Canna indica TaxID=4628 RepID=A0AAQ3KBY9_9LILI|nr:hypothetical protein Cni_G14590 [Canna indica]